jgi:thiamine biosynthesis lipoprotein
MGGNFEVKLYPSSHFKLDEIKKIIQNSFSVVSDIERKFTDFKSSPFNEINKQAGKRSVIVDHEIMDLIKRSKDFSVKSNGIFDISYASVGNIWRDYLRDDIEPNESEIKDCKQLIDYNKIEINEKAMTVYLPHEKMKISMGGIGKGYAVDKLFERLRFEGLENFQINGSGDIRVHSTKNAPRPWKLGIRNPLAKNAIKLMGYLNITNGAVATSGDYNQMKIYKGKKIHHIISPSTGFSINDVVSATVFSKSAMEADVFATICLLNTADKAINILEENNLTGIVVHKSGRVLASNKVLKEKIA